MVAVPTATDSPRSASGSRDSARVSRSCTRQWTTGSATLDGERYQVEGTMARPLPLQPGGIPIWMAGAGGEGDPQDRGEVRVVHELRGHARGVRPQERGAARALQQAWHRLRRDHALIGLTRLWVRMTRTCGTPARSTRAHLAPSLGPQESRRKSSPTCTRRTPRWVHRSRSSAKLEERRDSGSRTRSTDP